MQLLYVGQLADDHNRDDIWVRGFERNGINISVFSSYQYEQRLKGIHGKIANRIHRSSVFTEMRRHLLNMVDELKPAWVHFRLPLHFDSKTLRLIKNSGAIITSYYNDDPFSKRRIIGLHSMFISSISEYHIHFLFRQSNITDFKKKNAQRIVVCEPFYDPSVHSINVQLEQPKKQYDAVFIGHWEDDGRQNVLETLVSSGLKVRVSGPGWRERVSGTPLDQCGPFDPIFGSEYAKLYSSAHAGLCFFSKMNNDTWTRRPLEIVAVGGLLVCERTTEARNHFQEKKDAYYFSSAGELMSVIYHIKSNQKTSERVRQRGRLQLLSKRYSIDDRINMMIREIQGVLK